MCIMRLRPGPTSGMRCSRLSWSRTPDVENCGIGIDLHPAQLAGQPLDVRREPLAQSRAEASRFFWTSC